MKICYIDRNETIVPHVKKTLINFNHIEIPETPWVKQIVVKFLKLINFTVTIDGTEYLKEYSHTSKDICQLDVTEFIPNLLKIRSDIHRQLSQCNGKATLLIGPEEFCKYIDVPMKYNMSMMSINFNRVPHILGMKVVVVPWMQGCLLLPENFERI